MSLSEISSVEELAVFIQAFDTDFYDKNDHINMKFAQYVANTGMSDPDTTIVDVVDVIRICDDVIPDLSVEEGYGGMSASSGAELIRSIATFNGSENGICYFIDLKVCP